MSPIIVKKYFAFSFVSQIEGCNLLITFWIVSDSGIHEKISRSFIFFKMVIFNFCFQSINVLLDDIDDNEDESSDEVIDSDNDSNKSEKVEKKFKKALNRLDQHGFDDDEFGANKHVPLSIV